MVYSKNSFHFAKVDISRKYKISLKTIILPNGMVPGFGAHHHTPSQESTSDNWTK